MEGWVMSGWVDGQISRWMMGGRLGGDMNNIPSYTSTCNHALNLTKRHSLSKVKPGLEPGEKAGMTAPAPSGVSPTASCSMKTDRMDIQCTSLAGLRGGAPLWAWVSISTKGPPHIHIPILVTGGSQLRVVAPTAVGFTWYAE